MLVQATLLVSWYYAYIEMTYTSYITCRKINEYFVIYHYCCWQDLLERQKTKDKREKRTAGSSFS